MEQFFKIVDQNKTEVRWQSEWFGKFDLADVIRLTSKFTVAQFLSRDDFNKRFMAGKPITITELLYPLLQAYDSVAIQADVEFGGIDQKFNFLVGRELQVMMGQLPQQCFMTPLLVGTDGSHKMSKSLDNYIGITEPPTEIYGKIMSIPDSLMMDYFELLTDIPDKELNKLRQVLNTETINPMELKKRLAREIITQLYDKKAASEAEEYFEKVFQRRELPDQIEEFPLDLVGKDVSPGDVDVADVHIPRLLVKIGLAKSLREANRLIAQGAVSIKGLTRENGEKILSNTANIFTGDIIKVGNRRFARIGGEVMIMPPDPDD
jgi:tyrosyl-tRNA synthetase